MSSDWIPAHPLLAPAFLQGWLTMAGLIVAIGAQNALVLQQGLRRTHVGPVVALCTVSDWLLVLLGVYGLGALIQASPLLLDTFRYGGAAFLLFYGLMALRRAWLGSVPLSAGPGRAGLAATLGTALALTYLNPHVYLDTVVLIGGIGAQQSGQARHAFVAGAGLASLMWFALLGYGAFAAARYLQRPGVWRAIDATVAAVMFLVAAQLLARPLG